MVFVVESMGMQAGGMLAMKEVRIGTSGFDYRDWHDVFYPEELPRDRYLQYYSRFFSRINTI